MAAEIPFRIFENTCDYGEILELQENLRNDVIAKTAQAVSCFLSMIPSTLRGFAANKRISSNRQETFRFTTSGAAESSLFTDRDNLLYIR